MTNSIKAFEGYEPLLKFPYKFPQILLKTDIESWTSYSRKLNVAELTTRILNYQIKLLSIWQRKLQRESLWKNIRTDSVSYHILFPQITCKPLFYF